MKITLMAAVLVVLPGLAAAEKPHAAAEVAVRTARITTIDAMNASSRWRGRTARRRRSSAGPKWTASTSTVSMRYYRSVVYLARKAGQPSALPATSATPWLSRGHGKRPAATLSQQQTATVTIEAIDRKVPAVTAVTDDGRRMSFEVPRRKDIAGLNVADRLEIVYTEALVISVE